MPRISQLEKLGSASLLEIAIVHDDSMSTLDTSKVVTSTKAERDWKVKVLQCTLLCKKSVVWDLEEPQYLWNENLLFTKSLDLQKPVVDASLYLFIRV